MNQWLPLAAATLVVISARFPMERSATVEDQAPLVSNPASEWVKGWGEILEQLPDPAVVTDAGAREAIAATSLPWKVREPISGAVLVLIPPGEYLRGGEKDDPDLVATGDPRLLVRVPYPLYVGQTEVTQSQWERVMGTNPSRYPGPERPLESVTWNEFQSFLTHTDLVLLRESEWEYVCRAGSQDTRPPEWKETAVYGRTLEAGTANVASKRPNAWGVYDMLGNVWEKTRTRQRFYRSDVNEDGIVDARNDDHHALTVDSWIMRGGSFGSDREHVHPALRNSTLPDKTDFARGFRISKEVPEELWPKAPESEG